MASQIETGLGSKSITLVRTAELAAVEYVKNPTNPQKYHDYQTEHWKYTGHVMGLAQSDLVVPNVPWTEDQMRQFMGKNLKSLLAGKHDTPFYLPEVVSGKDGLALLGKAYPWMGWNDGYMENIQNVDRDGQEVALSGHLRTEAVIDAPNTQTTEDQAAGILARLGRRGHTLNTYAEAGNESKLLTGKYLDETRTWVRVMLSRAHGQVMDAGFDPDGRCRVYRFPEPGSTRGGLGVRTVGV